MVKTNYGENYDHTMHKEIVVNFDFRANRNVLDNSFICEAEWFDGGGHLVSASGATYDEAKTKVMQMLDANGIHDCTTSAIDAQAAAEKERDEAMEVIEKIRILTIENDLGRIGAAEYWVGINCTIEDYEGGK